MYLIFGDTILSVQTEVGQQLLLISPSQIKRNEETLTLRKVNEDDPKFKDMVKSIGTPRVDEFGVQTCDHGLDNAILVRPIPGRPAGEYAICDGFHRLTAWRKAFGDNKPIPAMVKSMTDEQVLEVQVEANALKFETRPADFAKQIMQILDRHPERSLEEQAARLHVEANTVRQWLKLPSLPQSIQDMVNKGEIPVSVGIPLSRFKVNSKEEAARNTWVIRQKEWLDRYLATQEEPNSLQTWMAQVASAIKKIEKDIREQKREVGGTPSDFAVVFTLRKKSEVEIELKRTEDLFVNDGAFVSTVKDPEFQDFCSEYPKYVEAISGLGYRDALKYVGQVDEKTLNAKREAAERKRQEKEDKKETNKAGDKAETKVRATGQGLFALFGKKK